MMSPSSRKPIRFLIRVEPQLPIDSPPNAVEAHRAASAQSAFAVRCSAGAGRPRCWDPPSSCANIVSMNELIGAELAKKSVDTAAKAAENFLAKLTGPVAEELGAILQDRVRAYRFKNQLSMLGKAQE